MHLGNKGRKSKFHVPNLYNLDRKRPPKYILYYMYSVTIKVEVGGGMGGGVFSFRRHPSPLTQPRVDSPNNYKIA
jgi:hypothetical protein